MNQRSALRVGITQRLDRVPDRDEVREALDWNWGSILAGLDFVPIPLASGSADAIRYLETVGVDAVILSGGNDVAQGLEDPLSARRELFEKQVLQFSAGRSLPVFGVCRGLQMMNVELGGFLVRVNGHVATDHVADGRLCTMLGINAVNSFHKWGISPASLASSFHTLCRAPDGTVEAAMHATLPWLGVMWHPERPIPQPERHHFLLREWLMGHIERRALIADDC